MKKRLFISCFVILYFLIAAAWIISENQPSDILYELSLLNWREYEHRWPCWLGIDNKLKFDLKALPWYYLEEIEDDANALDLKKEINDEETANKCGLEVCDKLGWPLRHVRDGKVFEIYRDDVNHAWLIEEYGDMFSGGILLQEKFVMIVYDNGNGFVLF